MPREEAEFALSYYNSNTCWIDLDKVLAAFALTRGDILEAASTLSVHVGGAEFNVCAGLAHLGIPTVWISRLPSTPLGRRVAATVRGHGVSVDGVLWAPEGNVGLMLVQPGAGPRPGEVFYYRRDWRRWLSSARSAGPRAAQAGKARSAAATASSACFALAAAA